MKRMVMGAALLLGLVFGSFAQPMDRDDKPGFGPMMENLKPGEQLINEVKTVTGTILFSDRLVPALKEGSKEYTLLIPRQPLFGVNLKQGDTVTFEGLLITYKKADGTAEYYFHPSKGKVGDKEITFENRHRGPDRDGRPMGPGMMGGGPRW